MGKIVAVEAGDSKIMIESTDIIYDSTVVPAGGPQLEKNLNKMLEKLHPLCESIVTTFEGLAKKPESGSAEFGLSFAAEGNLFVVKASGEATIKITLNWRLVK